MHVTIVGAGIGGLALVHGLLADGHQVKVLERGPSPGTGGAAVTIFSNGAAALAGLGPELGGVGTRVDELQITRADGRELMHSDFAPLVRRSGFEVRTVPRAALLERLAHGLPADVIEYNTPVERIDREPGGPVVVRGAGASCRPQVLVGADGYRSVVRRDTVDSAPARDVGWATWQGLSEVLPSVAASTLGLLVVGDAGLVGMMPAGEGLVQWWFDVRWWRDQPELDSPAAWLREQFAAYAGLVPELLRAITDADIGLYPHVVHQVPDTWGSGATTLLGDAAHAFPPSQAQGANQALEDAWVLASALKTTGELQDALRAYEQRRAPRVRRVSRLAESERTNRPPNPLLSTAARLVPTAIASRAYARLVCSFSSVLNDERIVDQ